MTGTAVLVVDRLGRRPLLLGGVSGMVNKGCPVSQFFCYLLFFFLFQGCTCKNAKATCLMKHEILGVGGRAQLLVRKNSGFCNCAEVHAIFP
jgi:hypothetical protein